MIIRQTLSKNEYIDLKYLKAMGKKLYIKVSLGIVEINSIKTPVIWIRDYEFFSFKRALKYLQTIAETEMSCIGNRKGMDL